MSFLLHYRNTEKIPQYYEIAECTALFFSYLFSVK